MNLKLVEAARVMGGALIPAGEVARIRGAAIDSREVKPGDAFFALEGEWRDGHDFVGDSFRRGAAAAVVRREIPGAGGPQIVLPDPAEGLRVLAGWVRDVLDPVVVGITGSTGKTSVKDLLFSILSRRAPTVASPRSFNNDLGVPLTLLSSKTETRFVICEMGSRGRGHIKLLCDLARPQVGIVTNVGVAHFEQFGSQDAIAAAKAELVQSLPEGGAAVLNADDPLVMGMGSATHAEVFTFGRSPDAWVRAESVSTDRIGRPTMRMVRGREGVWVTLLASGAHQVSNALAASAAALALGLSVEDCREGLESAAISPWRMEVRTKAGVTFVNDAYNANPTSMASALSTSSGIAGSSGRLIAVLGYMAELGELEVTEHRRVGALAASLASKLIVVGERARPIASGATEAGMEDVRVVDDAESALEAIGPLRPGDV
ncbi:MAG: UDP-N-acetylmuramoyl-tripeptide--D-alanyl-D-alanine ligase, partial [Actinomycetota bacterium]|nr:UDP-N-acetylmuramoyl-tripeptide--D-alanyl-D-alanine ligase [Actinomycetota bacterium]